MHILTFKFESHFFGTYDKNILNTVFLYKLKQNNNIKPFKKYL